MSTKKNKRKIAVAMSGGVDSSVVAKMMVDQGYQVVGLFLKLWSDPTTLYVPRPGEPPCFLTRQNRCCDYEALSDAREMADKLGIKFYVIDAQKEFKDAIVDEFISEYKKLRTPNPCIKCNEYIKFELLLKKALGIGAEKLATGHYARIENVESVIPAKAGIQKRDPSAPLRMTQCHLKAGLDPSKDQSYMIYRLNQKQLSRVMFPLGKMLKKDVRKLAVDWDLPVKEKPESQEICFFGDRDYRTFLRRYLDASFFKSGDTVDKKGNILGAHKGLVNYTIGQRKGIEQVNGKQYTVNSDKKPLYVVGFDAKKNQLIVGEDKEVYKREMIVSNLNWINGLINLKINKLKNIFVKIRYRHDTVPCKIELKNSKTDEPKKIDVISSATEKSSNSVIPSEIKKSSFLKVIFNEPQRAITPGQSAVFYINDEVLGGGIIEN